MDAQSQGQQPLVPVFQPQVCTAPTQIKNRAACSMSLSPFSTSTSAPVKPPHVCQSSRRETGGGLLRLSLRCVGVPLLPFEGEARGQKGRVRPNPSWQCVPSAAKKATTLWPPPAAMPASSALG
ncbi:hypothetical protein DNTS_015840, partial [Danionella cerebrum]